MTKPKRLFKYLDQVGAEKVLETGTLLFSSPLYFNDPFDISIQSLFGFDHLDLEKQLDAFVELISSKENLPKPVGSAASKLFIQMHAILSKASKEYIENFRKSISPDQIWNKDDIEVQYQDMLNKIKIIFDSSGIFCASKKHDNYLLWAHYADKHQGAVIEFAPNFDKDSILILAEEISYSDERPHLYHSQKEFLMKSMFRDTLENLNDFTRAITMTKSSEWAYEEELRVYTPALINIFQGEKNRALSFHDDELRAIYLGCKMNRESKLNLASLAKARNPLVEVFEMIPDAYQYRLHCQSFIEKIM